MGRAVLVAILCLACGGDGAPRERSLAPAFELPDLAGEIVRLADFAGRTVVIDFWATWCPPCEFQIPVLNAVHDAWRERGVVVLGVAVDAEGIEKVGPYVAEHEVRYPILLGDEALARKFGAVGFPSSVLIAPDGTMTKAHAGLLEQADLDAQIACLASPSGEPVAPSEPDRDAAAS